MVQGTGCGVQDASRRRAGNRAGAPSAHSPTVPRRLELKDDAPDDEDTARAHMHMHMHMRTCAHAHMRTCARTDLMDHVADDMDIDERWKRLLTYLVTD